MLGEFFLCSPDRLDGELIAAGPHGRLPCVSAKGLTPVNIASLGEILGSGTYDEIFEQCGVQHYESDSGGSGVWDCPGVVGEALQAGGALEPVAERWVATEELRLDGWQPSDGLGVLKELAQLLGDRAEGQVLWYWWSL